MDFRMLHFGMALCRDALVQVLVIAYLVLCMLSICAVEGLHNTAIGLAVLSLQCQMVDVYVM